MIINLTPLASVPCVRIPVVFFAVGCITFRVYLLTQTIDEDEPAFLGNPIGSDLVVEVSRLHGPPMVLVLRAVRPFGPLVDEVTEFTLWPDVPVLLVLLAIITDGQDALEWRMTIGEFAEGSCFEFGHLYDDLLQNQDPGKIPEIYRYLPKADVLTC